MASFEHNSPKFGYLNLDDLGHVQKALAALGFDPGKIDDIDGPNTQKAVRAFQAHATIDIDGKVGKTTRKALQDALDAHRAGDRLAADHGVTGTELSENLEARPA